MNPVIAENVASRRSFQMLRKAISSANDLSNRELLKYANSDAQNIITRHRETPESLNFAHIGPSSISGNGVFARTAIESGQCLGFFPGRCFHPPPPEAVLDSPKKVPEFYQSWDHNDKAINRYDGVLIDARFFDKPVASERMEFNKAHNKIAFGHMINHPPKGQTPNVLAFPVEFAHEEIGENDFIPYENHDLWYYSEEMGDYVTFPSCMSVKGIGIFSARHILPEEELFLDYDLKFVPLPEWYHPVYHENEE
mmetsp:Transcript_17415/g.27826  ORF Transcript_17415/g.27826 Transcript_17415/m.27826 type:complete len:253 (-) Transcript_17415:34-792(-)